MTFTRNHYQSVADVINNAMENMDQPQVTNYSYLVGKVAGIEEIATTMADMFAKDNERFNRTLFIEACGLAKS